MPMDSKIRNPYRMRQLIDFTGLELEGGIYPTDIDGLIEYHDQEYILIEVKYGKAKVPFGQRLAIERMIKGDILIDDGVHNLLGGEYTGVLMDAPHNADFHNEDVGIVRVHSWDEIYKVVEEIAKKGG